MTPEQKLALARECACQSLEVYGEGDAREHDAAVLRTIWNDHPAVQSALLAIERTRIETLEEAALVCERMACSIDDVEDDWDASHGATAKSLAAFFHGMKGQSNDQG